MAPIKIVEGGILRNDIEREYLIRSRTPELNALDLAGQIAANRHAATQVEQICRRYGTATLTAALAQLLEPASANYASASAPCPTAVGATPPTSSSTTRAPDGRRRDQRTTPSASP